MMYKAQSCFKVLEVLKYPWTRQVKLKKFVFRMQVVLNMREKELEERQMEMAKILAALNEQKARLQSIFAAQEQNTAYQNFLLPVA